MQSGTLPSEPLVGRFSRTERTLHWVHAVAFLVLLGSGLVLFVPALSELVNRRPFVKDVHLYTALAWACAIVLVAALGDRQALRRSAREVDRFDADDRQWLRGRRVPQGRLNAGQKVNVVLTAAFAVLFVVSGFVMWYGERDRRFRLEGAIVLHDALMYGSLVLLLGHLYLAVIHPGTRHALRGITSGVVREDWAASHHAKWLEAERSKRPETPSDA